MTDTVVILTAGTSWTVPGDWNPAANKIEAIGGGAAGGSTVGGAGAYYAKIVNQSLSGSISYAIGAAGTSGGNGGDTTFSTTLLAKGGGSSSTGIGSTTYAGGTTSSAGGGGAAGPSGAGGNASGSTGGTADNGTVAADASGTEWVTAGSGGGGSASSAPAVVQSTDYTGFTSSPPITFPSTATSGNLLQVIVYPGSGATVTTPSGWTLATTAQSTSRPQWLFTKISNGTETGLTLSLSASASVGAAFAEWSGATHVSRIIGNSFASGISSGTVGPSDSAPSPTAIPVTTLICRAGAPNIATVGSGWTILNNTASSFAPKMCYKATPPNAAVSMAFTLTGTTSDYLQYAEFWVY